MLQILGLLLGVPLLIALVISTWSYLATTRELRLFGPPVNPTTTFAGAPGVEGAADEVRAGIESTAGAGTGVGGASARW